MLSSSPSESHWDGDAPGKSLPTGKTSLSASAGPLAAASSPLELTADAALYDSSRDTTVQQACPVTTGADGAAFGSGGVSVPNTPRTESPELTSPLLSSSPAPERQPPPQSVPPPPLFQERRLSQSRGSRATGRPLGTFMASGGGTAASQDYVDVVVRLKPTLAPSADAYMSYSIEEGSLPTPPRTGRRANGDRSPGPSTHTPRTARLTVESASQTPSARGPRTARNGGTPTQPPGNQVFASSASSSHFSVTNSGATGTVLTLNCPAKPTSSPLSAGGPSEEQRSYEFGEVLDSTVSDAEMCERLVPPILDQLAGGYNVCVLCYGQTGSGKTHTISALTPFLTKELFDGLDSASDIVEVSYVQIYNNRAYDLLGKTATGEDYGVPLPRPAGSAVCEPKVFVRTAADVMKRINAAQKYRCTGTNRLNARSSRSHTLLSLHLTRCLDGVPLTTNRVTLADLAGSERVKRSGAQGDELAEAIHINKSLHTLHSLIIATANDSGVLPYRESLLTRYLAPRLKEWHILLIVTASLERSSAAETKSSLDFALTAKRCVVTKRRPRTADRVMNAAPLASDLEEVCGHLQTVVATLRQRVEELQEELAAKQEASTLPAARLAEKEWQIEAYRSLLREREADLVILRDQTLTATEGTPRGGGSEVTAALMDEVSARDAARERTQELLARLRTMLPQPAQRCSVRSGLSSDSTNDADADVVDSLSEAFLWSHVRLDSMCEQYRVLERVVDGLRADSARLKAEMQEQRKVLIAREAEMAAVVADAGAAREKAEKDTVALQDHHASYFVNLVKRMVRSEMVGLYGLTDTLTSCPWTLLGDANSARGTAAPTSRPVNTESGMYLKEQKEEYDSMAAELAGLTRNLSQLQTEFDSKERSRAKLEKDLERCSHLLSSFWHLATPALKGKLLNQSSSGAGAALSATAASPVSHSLRSSNGGSDVGSSLRTSTGGSSVAQGLAVVQLKARVHELEHQLASTQAKASDAERELGEQQQTIAELVQENAKVAGVMNNWMELMMEHEKALSLAEEDRDRLHEVIDSQQGAIYEAGAALEREENMKNESRRQWDVACAQNEGLKRQIDAMQLQNKKHEAALRAHEREAAEHLKSTEEFYKAKILKLEWRLQQMAESRSNRVGNGAAVTGNGGVGALNTALYPIDSAATGAAAIRPARVLVRNSPAPSRKTSTTAAMPGPLTTPNVLRKRQSRLAETGTFATPFDAQDDAYRGRVDDGFAASHRQVTREARSPTAPYAKLDRSRPTWLPRHKTPQNGPGAAFTSRSSPATSHVEGGAQGNWLATAPDFTNTPPIASTTRKKEAARASSSAAVKGKKPRTGTKSSTKKETI